MPTSDHLYRLAAQVKTARAILPEPGHKVPAGAVLVIEKAERDPSKSLGDYYWNIEGTVHLWVNTKHNWSETTEEKVKGSAYYSDRIGFSWISDTPERGLAGKLVFYLLNAGNPNKTVAAIEDMAR